MRGLILGLLALALAEPNILSATDHSACRYLLEDFDPTQALADLHFFNEAMDEYLEALRLAALSGTSLILKGRRLVRFGSAAKVSIWIEDASWVDRSVRFYLDQWRELIFSEFEHARDAFDFSFGPRPTKEIPTDELATAAAKALLAGSLKKGLLTNLTLIYMSYQNIDHHLRRRMLRELTGIKSQLLQSTPFEKQK